jgi:hypothetical protein
VRCAGTSLFPRSRIMPPGALLPLGAECPQTDTHGEITNKFRIHLSLGIEVAMVILTAEAAHGDPLAGFIALAALFAAGIWVYKRVMKNRRARSRAPMRDEPKVTPESRLASAVVGNGSLADCVTPADHVTAEEASLARAVTTFDLLNMWWHRLGFPSETLPPYSEACLRCGGTIRLLYTGATCPNCDGTGLRFGVPSADYERLRGDGRLHRLAEGPIAGHAVLMIGNRTAQLAIPGGWQQRPPAQITEIQAIEGDGSTVIAQLHPSALAPGVVYAVTVSRTRAPVGFLGVKSLLRLVVAVERDMDLRAVSRIEKVEFGGEVGRLWHLEGRMPGRLLGRPDQPVISVHCAELWARVDAGTVLKILLTAPLQEAQEARAALDTVISSWRWEDRVDARASAVPFGRPSSSLSQSFRA